MTPMVKETRMISREVVEEKTKLKISTIIEAVAQVELIHRMRGMVRARVTPKRIAWKTLSEMAPQNMSKLLRLRQVRRKFCWPLLK